MTTTDTTSADTLPPSLPAGNARFTFLSNAIVRIEHTPDARFEDRPTLAFPDRTRTLPTEVTLTDLDDTAPITPERFAQHGGTVHTPDITLRYDPAADNGQPTKRSLSVTLKHPPHTTWHPGADDAANLLGTRRTLDHISGSAPLDNGLVSRDGWALHDDSHTPILVTPKTDEPNWHDEPWPQARNAHPDAKDLYLFAHARDYKRALREFTAISGPVPLPPRYALGLWWSRYWPYTDTDLRLLAQDFDHHNIPLDVLVIDMDWHLTGWTGYTWDPSCFPDPGAFLTWCHDNDLAVTLNLHPADGVGKHERAFWDMRIAVGGDHTMYRVPFDCTDPAYVKPYFELLHHPLEDQGVDFWWMDWQQGNTTPVENLDPLPWLNHIHFRDMEINPKRAQRPLVFSRWGGLGGHRYPIGFSGDTFNDWESLAFQPHFTATAANVAFAYWSHDIGGHQPGPVEPELFARWIQFGALSPILRTHASKNPDAERRIWHFPQDTQHAAKRAIDLRYQLLHYIDAACRNTFDTGLALCRPMYHEHPDTDAAYDAPNQYYFGPDLIAAPVLAPIAAKAKTAPVNVWLPRGTWTEWFTNTTHHTDNPEGHHITVDAPLDEIPLFARENAIIPTLNPAKRVYKGAPDALRLDVFPGSPDTPSTHTTTLYDDDGTTDAYRTRNEHARTNVTLTRTRDSRRVDIHPTDNNLPAFPTKRHYEVRFREDINPKSVTVNNEPLPHIDPPRSNTIIAPVHGYWTSGTTHTLTVSIPNTPTNAMTSIKVEG